jgi:hypothetical protein
MRDPNDTDVLQTAERGEADILYTHDGDFYDDAVLSFCATRGIDFGQDQVFSPPASFGLNRNAPSNPS